MAAGQPRMRTSVSKSSLIGALQRQGMAKNWIKFRSKGTESDQKLA